MSRGFLFVANKQKFINEAKIYAKSIRRFSNLPIAIVCSQDLVCKELKDFFDVIVVNSDLSNYIYI